MTIPLQTKPSLYWREVLRASMFRAPKDDAEFLGYCELRYAQSKKSLEDLLERSGSPRDIGAERFGVFWMAMAVLTYGRLDVIGDVLENFPPRSHPANRGLQGLVHALIPVPRGLRANDSPGEVLAWIRANESHLRWDEEAGRFIFEPQPRG